MFSWECEMVDYLSASRNLQSRMQQEFDSSKREIVRIWFDEDLKITSKTTFEYDDKTGSMTERHYDYELNLVINKCGVAAKVIFYSSPNFLDDFFVRTEERFLDKDMKLIDCKHNYTYDYDFAVVKRKKLPNNRLQFTLLNAKGEVVKEDVFVIEQ